MKHFSDISWFLPAKNRASGFLRQYDAVPKNRCWNTIIIIITVIYFPVERQSLLLLALAEYMDFKKKKPKRFKVMLAVHEFCMLLLFKMVLIARLYHLTCHRERWTISPYRLKIPTTQTKLFNLRIHSAYIMFYYIYIWISPSWTETDEKNFNFLF